MLNNQEAGAYILECEFPSLRYNSDSEIELYYHYRAVGTDQQSRMIYSRLLRKYPDYGSRVLLLKLYRTRSPQFYILLAKLKNDLQQRMIVRITKLIDYFCRTFKDLDISNPLYLLQGIEILRPILPQQKQSVLNLLDRLGRYSRKLDYRTNEFVSINTLVMDFYTGRLFPKKIEKIKFYSPVFKEKKREIPSSKNKMDFSKVSFTKEQLSQITINSKIEKKEDQVLSFCARYWFKTLDQQFERLVFLYSMKYGTNHSRIFEIIKLGKKNHQREDEILMRVYSIVSQNYGYDYNVRRDIYMQRLWRRIKAELKHAQELSIEQKKKVIEKKKRFSKKNTSLNEKENKNKISRSRSLPHAKSVKKGSDQTEKLKKNSIESTQSIKKNIKQEQSKAVVSLTPIKHRNTLFEELEQMGGQTGKNFHILFRQTMEEYLNQIIKERYPSIKEVNVTLARIELMNFYDIYYNGDLSEWSMSNYRLKVKEFGVQKIDPESLAMDCIKKLKKQYKTTSLTQ